jgi:hypothetical protein
LRISFALHPHSFTHITADYRMHPAHVSTPHNA